MSPTLSGLSGDVYDELFGTPCSVRGGVRAVAQQKGGVPVLGWVDPG